MNKNHAPGLISLNFLVATFKNTYEMKPIAMPLAIEKVKGIIIIIISAGNNSVLSDQLSLSTPPSINSAT